MQDEHVSLQNAKPIHVCFISLEIYLLFNPKAQGVQGGAEVDAYMIATELAKDKNYKVSVITGDFGQPEIEVIDDITIYKTANLSKHPFLAVMTLWRAMKRCSADIYFRKGASLVTFIIALYCFLHKRPLLLRTSHDWECNGTYLKQSWLRGRAFLWVLKKTALVFVQKTADQINLKNNFGISSHVIPNAHRIIDSLQSEQRDFILWVGRSADFKRPQLFIKLASLFPSERFVMICQKSHDDNIYSSLKEKSARLTNLKFIEKVPFSKIDTYFEQATVFINTSDSEGFPNTFIQACKSSTAILSLDVNPGGFLEKYNCGFCAVGEWSKFVDFLKYMLDQNRYMEMGKNARRYACDNHDISKIIEEYKKYFADSVTK